jgi:hypothetical protein
MASTTTTKKGKTVLPDWETELTEQLERADQRRRAAYALMLRFAAGEEPTAEELQFLRHCGFDDSARRREEHRFARALALLRQAGTRAEREAAAAQLAGREADLTAAIARLTAEIDRLVSERTNAEADLHRVRANVARREAAVAALQAESILPEHICGQLRDIRKAESGSLPARAEREAESRIKTIRGVLALTDNQRMLLHADAVRRDGGPDMVVRQSSDRMAITPRINPTLWAEYLERLRTELPDRERELDEARRELTLFSREGEDLRNFWLSEEVESMVLEINEGEENVQV